MLRACLSLLLRSRFSRHPRLASKLRLQPEASTIMSAPLQGSAASSPMRTIPLLRQAQGVSGSAFPRGTHTPDAPLARQGANGASAASRTAVGSRSASTRQQVASRRGYAGRRAVAAQQRRMDLRVSFLLGSAQLTDQAREEAKVFATALQLPELAAKRFRIEGHTDSSGSRALNLDLSKRRAQAVADYLASLGVNSARLEVRGYGPDKPLARHSRELAGKSPRGGGAALIRVA